MPFEHKRLKIPEILLIKTAIFEDQRGFFEEIYKYSDFVAMGIKEKFVQDNYSHSICGVLRGLHYQKGPKVQGKLVWVLSGKIFDIVVDLRKNFPTYGQWVSTELSSDNRHMLYVPPGFAHGFCVLSPQADVVYKVTEEYEPALEGGIRWNDPAIGVNWPTEHPILSAKDAQLPILLEAEHDFNYQEKCL